MKKTQSKTNQVDSAVKMTFSLSRQNPIRLINHQWDSPHITQYDMHYGLEFGIVLENSMHRSWPGHEKNISAGETWICGMWEPHGFELLKTPCRALVFIIFPPMLAHSFLEESPQLNFLDVFRLPPKKRPEIPAQYKTRLLTTCEDLYRLNQNPDNIPGGQAFIHLKLMEILLLLTQTTASASQNSLASLETFSQINIAIDKVFSTNEYIPAAQAARLCHMHRNTFRKVFEETMGISFSEFALRYRLTRCADELLHTDLPVKTIAANWGFSDTSHFTKTFKTYYHASPSEYRATVY